MPLVLSSLSEKGESEKERKEALKSVDDAAFTLVSASFLLGFSHAAGGKEEEVKEGKKALADDDISFHADSSFHEVPFREAVDFLKSRVPTLKPEWKKIERELQFRAFTMALLTREDLLEKARKHLTAVAEAGGGVREFWSGARKSDWAEGLVAGYFETVFRTNVQTAYCAGRLMQYKNAKNEAYELLFMDDERTSDTCRSLQSKCAGRAIAKADRFWKVVGYPPYHYNCRTTLRAVYPEEKPERVSFTESELSHYREDVGDFGGDPIASGSFWKLTAGMAERITKYGLTSEVESFAKKVGLKNYDIRLARGVGKRKLEGTEFEAKIINGAEPKQHEIEIARILKENGHDVLFTPENTFIKGIKNPEGVITDINKTVEMKQVTSENLNVLRHRVKEAIKQGSDVIVLHLKGAKPYSKEEISNVIKSALNEERAKRDVWYILNGKLIK